MSGSADFVTPISEYALMSSATRNPSRLVWWKGWRSSSRPA
jgi:hypothetical protein